jgi:hypothetical protein
MQRSNKSCNTYMMLRHHDTIHNSWWCLFGEINSVNISKKFLWQQSFATELTERENAVKFL